ncbi:hypothetical protein MTsPCn9_10270 [Croceitalea sp. MTPC9]|uniref:cyclic GMP-AMP synthase DncV-like nucleotidyltransferase n=1 Tax=unclassified Croceitalea TaxID=2632280 RepID=UPI002B399B56|nr:hypothetical protein MTsPCn6_26970 [Croceitalea sp. MTPC6]GMN16091.1 hypothetical protein MTsPCn9_10270 [Croceitalea sp. MTPC9]
MANCNTLFLSFNKSIRLDDDRRINLREKRDNLRKRIKGGFGEVRKLHTVNEELEFQSQGSYVMDTIINPANPEDEYDIDDGVYFFGQRSREHRGETKNYHDFIIASIKSGIGQNEIEEIKEKDTCVRVRYRGKKNDFNYHVDLPIYYATDMYHPDLAHKKKSWLLSNPVDFILWFERIIDSGFEAKYLVERSRYEQEYQRWLDDRRKKDHQLRRIVRYLKAWGDHLKGEMPPGVVMTILAGSDSNYVANERDDISLLETLKNIRQWLRNNQFTCPRPTIPVGEDLFADYPQSRIDYFRDRLDAFISSGEQALENPNQKDACKKWQKHLGDRFPCFMAKDEIEGAKTYVAPAYIKSDNSRSA